MIKFHYRDEYHILDVHNIRHIAVYPHHLSRKTPGMPEKEYIMEIHYPDYSVEFVFPTMEEAESLANSIEMLYAAMWEKEND